MAVSDPPSLRKALAFYEQAVALDPGFVQAWAQVSRASSVLYLTGTPTPELAERARQAAEKAVALAPNRPEGYAALGHFHRVISRDAHRALEVYAKGQRFAPRSADLLSGIRAGRRVPRALGCRGGAIQRSRAPRPSLDRRPSGDLARRSCVCGARRRRARFSIAVSSSRRPISDLIEDKAVTFLAEGDLRWRPGRAQGRAQGGRADRARGLRGDLLGSRLGPRRRSSETSCCA